jgi:hypothetical protein
MAERGYLKPTWSYPDSMGPALHYGHVPEFNGPIPPYQERQTVGVGSENDHLKPATA